MPRHHYADVIIAAYLNGASLADIGDAMDCTPPTVSALLKKNGVQVRHRGRRKKEHSAPGVLDLGALPLGEGLNDE